MKGGEGQPFSLNRRCPSVLVELALVPLVHQALPSHPLASSGDVLFRVLERLLTEMQASCFAIFWVPYEPCRPCGGQSNTCQPLVAAMDASLGEIS